MERRLPGIVEFFNEPVGDVIQAPDEAMAGIPFEVTAHTFGDGCTRLGDTEVQVDGNTATLLPFDIFVSGPDVVCPAILRRLPHTVDLRFDAAGPATIRVRGRKVTADGESVVTQEKAILVR